METPSVQAVVKFVHWPYHNIENCLITLSFTGVETIVNYGPLSCASCKKNFFVKHQAARSAASIFLLPLF